MRGLATVLSIVSILYSILRTSTTLNSIEPGQSIRDGETLVSTDGIFELGFFSPADVRSRYVGLWYKNKSPQTVVWVANRETPLSNTLGALNMTSPGILTILNSTNHIVWSSNTSRIVRDPIVELLESGNVVVRERNDSSAENFLWQSFDYPCDTFMPGMKIGSNLKTGLARVLSSWKSTVDPATGQFSLELDPHGYPQVFLKKGSQIQVRMGSWNGQRPTGSPRLKPNPTFSVEFVLNENEVYYKYELQNSSVFVRYTLNPSGVLQRFTWSDQTKDWVVFSSAQIDQCENYAICGAYASCDVNSFPVCACLDGFMPKSPKDWNSSIWSEGCVRRTPLNCNSKDGFLKYTGIKMPDTSSSWFNRSIDLRGCKNLCLRNCSCTGYANLDITGHGNGCLLWFDELIDIRRLSDGRQDLYIRMAASDLEKIMKKGPFTKKQQAAIIASSVIFIMGLLTFLVFYMRSRKNTNNCEGMKEDMELPTYDLATIAYATNNFSSSNKLGQGGFGPVYKGTLTGGQQIAVKRLSKSSGQGLNEFKNEVVLIAKLQHRNLVKLLGCCIHEEERMLIYELLPNKSLDFFIFDQTRSNLLNWNKRMNIIAGIGRGLLYLHQDSRLRIIHRDIKASNILLDEEINPKISDFGLARMFGGDQTEADTNRIVGTYGYMSPEYALDGHFSVKSDVFSFGVLVLEIVSGKRNRGFYHPDQDHNLLGHAWMLWNEGKAMELIDECLTDSCIPSEVLRCIHVALLCVQQRAEDRPNMSSVVLILGSEIQLPRPKQPGFLMGRSANEPDTSSNKNASYSANEASMTSLEGR